MDEQQCLHQGLVTNRKCFFCSRQICLRCQVKMDHHLFCGGSCHAAYTNSLNEKIGNAYKRYAMYSSLVVLLGGFLYFALLADAFYSGGNDVAKPNQTQIGLSLPLDINAQPLEEILIQRPPNGTKSSTPTLSVGGNAPANSVVAIYLNGTLTDKTVAKEGAYTFPKVHLTKHANVLQTRFYAANGSSGSSPAILVFNQSRTQTQQMRSPFFENSPENISRGDLNRKDLAITFDGDSDANSCESILRALDQANVRSTLFLTREFMERYPELTRKIAFKHEVGQKITSDGTREAFQNQLRTNEELFLQITGRDMARLWRASTEGSLQYRDWAEELGYIHVAWTMNPATRQNTDAQDSVSNADSPEYFPSRLIKDRLLSFGQNEPEQANGSIVRIHLGNQRQPDDRLEHWLPEMLETFRQRGYRLVTATELLSHPMAQATNPATFQMGQ